MHIKNVNVCFGFFSKQNKLPGHKYEFYVPEILGTGVVIFAVKNKQNTKWRRKCSAG
jgi:hypothetical protein